MVGIGNKGTITLAIIKCIQEELTLNFIPYIYTTVLQFDLYFSNLLIIHKEIND